MGPLFVKWKKKQTLFLLLLISLILYIYLLDKNSNKPAICLCILDTEREAQETWISTLLKKRKSITNPLNNFKTNNTIKSHATSRPSFSLILVLNFFSFPFYPFYYFLALFVSLRLRYESICIPLLSCPIFLICILPFCFCMEMNIVVVELKMKKRWSFVYLFSRWMPFECHYWFFVILG